MTNTKDLEALIHMGEKILQLPIPNEEREQIESKLNLLRHTLVLATATNNLERFTNEQNQLN